MKNILKISTLALASAAMLTGCIEETFPTGSTATTEMISQSSTALEAMVGAIPVNMAYPYSFLGSSNNRGFDFGYPSLMLMTDSCVGDYACTDESGGGYDWFSFWKNGTGIGPTQSYSGFPWTCYYTFIKACNDVVSIIPMADDVETMSDAHRKYLGQAKAFRAQMYLDMARMYDALPVAYADYDDAQRQKVEGLTVPIITEATTESEARFLPRATRKEMFDEFLFPELDDAIALLDGISVTDKTAPTQAVAYGIKARAYLWLGQFDEANYAKAAECARQAIEVSGCTPLNEAEWTDPKTGFNTDNHAWMWYLPQSTEGVTNLVNYVAWLSSEATWGYGSLIFPGVTTDFYSKVSDSDWRKKLMVGEDIHEWFAQNQSLTNLSANPSADDYYEYGLNYCSFLKFRPAGGETTNYKVGNVTSVPIMRVEEMMLIEAEALAYSNTTAAANALQNFIDLRGGGYTFRTDKESIVKETIHQKRIELWGEGVVFYDFKRLNMGIETGYSGSNIPADCRFTTNGRAPWWNFCIPESETKQNLALEGYNNPNPIGIVKPWAE